MRIAILVAAVVCLSSCKKKCPPLPAESLVAQDVPPDVARVIIDMGKQNKVCGVNAHYPELVLDSHHSSAALMGEKLDPTLKAIGWNRVRANFNGITTTVTYGSPAGTIDFDLVDETCHFGKVCISKPTFYPPSVKR